MNWITTKMPDAHWLTEARLQGTRVVVIACEYSATSSKADEAIVVRPGTTSALALGVANVLLREKLYDAHVCEALSGLLAVILASWLIALPEYVFQVPANRIGHGHFTAPQLKIIQEVISIAAFVLFNAVYLKDRIRGSDWLAFGLILAAVVVMMAPRVTSVAAK